MSIFEPVAIGGIGGSGTRVIANIIQSAGLYMGGDLNGALDNLWFTLLFKQSGIQTLPAAEFSLRVNLFKTVMAERRPLRNEEIALLHDIAASDGLQRRANWLKARADSFLDSCQTCKPCRAWGWKEPNTHIVADRLAVDMPTLKYIHVARNGLDMAYSNNQNQPALWGAKFLDMDFDGTPGYSLKFWCRAHERILRIGQGMGKRFLFVNFDQLCKHPETGVRRIYSFISFLANEEQILKTTRSIHIPVTTGRHKSHSLSDFDESDVEYVRQLGFI